MAGVVGASVAGHLLGVGGNQKFKLQLRLRAQTGQQNLIFSDPKNRLFF